MELMGSIDHDKIPCLYRTVLNYQNPGNWSSKSIPTNFGPRRSQTGKEDLEVSVTVTYPLPEGRVALGVGAQ